MIKNIKAYFARRREKISKMKAEKTRFGRLLKAEERVALEQLEAGKYLKVTGN